MTGFEDSSSRRDSRSRRIGLVVHPERGIDQELGALGTWCSERGAELVQVGEQERDVAERGRAEECDLVLTLGGEGTALAGIRAGGEAETPVLAAACGSLGVLTTVTADALPDALDRFFEGAWRSREISALEAATADGESLSALNDLAVLRSGEGQLTTEATIDGVLYGRFVGDGFLVATPVGSTAYTLAAAGPLLAPGTTAFVLTPLSTHGGHVPPVVLDARSKLDLDVDTGHGAARLEVDGKAARSSPTSLTVRLRTAMATLVSFDDTEPLLSGLRRRWIIMDSPRVLARDET